MATTNQISDLKNAVCSALVNDSNIVSALSADDVQDDLMYTHIFPNVRRPDTEQEKRTFICMKVNVYAESKRNDLHKTLRFVLYVITHDDLQYVDSGVAYGCTRIDYIADQIEILFNKNKIGFGNASLVSNIEDQADARHPMRIITFDTDGMNGAMCQ